MKVKKAKISHQIKDFCAKPEESNCIKIQINEVNN